MTIINIPTRVINSDSKIYEQKIFAVVYNVSAVINYDEGRFADVKQ